MVETVHQPGSLAKVLQVIADAGLAIEHLTALRREQGRTLWEITLEMDEEFDRCSTSASGSCRRHASSASPTASSIVTAAARSAPWRAWPSIPARCCVTSTPRAWRGCVLPSRRIRRRHANTPRSSNTVAIVTNGTAVLGLGNIGALAGLPVMEGKAALFAELVGINGVPILLTETEPQRVVEAVLAIESGFGAIQLEDFAAPECFEIESQLQRAPGEAGAARRPARHGGGGTGGAAERGALLAARNLRTSTVGQIGLGAAGTGIARLLRASGVRHLLGTDRNPAAVARLQAAGGEGATLESLMQRADIVIATTGVKGLIPPQWVRPGQVILALSNPDPEIEPLVAREQGAAFAADGKGINNLLAYPGLFKGALEANATAFSDAMLMAAADAIAGSGGRG